MMPSHANGAAPVKRGHGNSLIAALKYEMTPADNLIDDRYELATVA